MDEKKIAEATGSKLKLVNDLYALASAVPFLDEEDILTVWGAGPNWMVFKAILAPAPALDRVFLFRSITANLN